MDRTEIIAAIAVSAAITFALRALPFIVFRHEKKMPEKLIYLGNVLPTAIMAVLIIYCLKDTAINFRQYGVPQLTAVILVAVSYKYKHNMMLSILLGTACNMILLRVMQGV